MNRITITSTALSSIGYEDQEQYLEVEFSDQQVYRYYQVPRAFYDDLVKADSKGTYFNAVIRPYYAGVRVKPSPRNQVNIITLS
jgi:hypothetical protein